MKHRIIQNNQHSKFVIRGVYSFIGSSQIKLIVMCTKDYPNDNK